MSFATVFSRWFGPRVTDDERALFVRCRGDQELMERLIRHELLRRPRATRAVAARSALEHWNRDR